MSTQQAILTITEIRLDLIDVFGWVRFSVDGGDTTEREGEIAHLELTVSNAHDVYERSVTVDTANDPIVSKTTGIITFQIPKGAAVNSGRLDRIQDAISAHKGARLDRSPVTA